MVFYEGICQYDCEGRKSLSAAIVIDRGVFDGVSAAISAISYL